MILIATKKYETFIIQSQKLQNIGYKAIHVDSYEESLKILKNKMKVNLILIDMDTIDGFSLIIKDIASTFKLPIVCITDYPENGISQDLYTDYYYGCILKNSEDFILQSCVKTALNLFESNRKIIEKYNYIQQAELIAGFGSWEFNLINKTIKASKGAREIYGLEEEIYSREEITKYTLPEYREILDKAFEDLIYGSGNYNVEFKIKNQTNNKIISVQSTAKYSPDKNIIIGTLYDITKRKSAEEKIKKLAYYDLLTNLPNRRMFFHYFKNLISQGTKNDLNIALLNIDLDGFKNVNDSFGHHVGDKLLIKVANRLKENIVKNQMICRLGGDEFAIIIQNVSDRQTISNISNRVIELIKKPFIINNKEIFISASIGIAIYPYDGTDVNTLLKNSDLAMYKAKNKGKNIHSFFFKDMNRITNIKMKIKTDLHNAVKNNEFQLYYQPKIDVLKNKVIGAECLIRWFKDGKQYVGPSEFISVAESTGFILEIDKWVLLTACMQIKKWIKMGIKDQKMSVNISGRHFKDGRIIETVSEVLKKVDIPFGSLEIEITEGVFMEDMNESIVILNELRSMGIDISIDDFGTGYSSLSYLKNLPINRIKIDRSFISNLLNSKKDTAIVKTIITMANLLDLYVIAEGVETSEQLKLLTENGCSEIQGFYFSKPMPIKQYEEFLKSWNQKKYKSNNYNRAIACIIG
jgi:diguanylate cyclase (GGDEF)-like protein